MKHLHTAYVCENTRTPIGRYGGALSSMRTDDLAAHPISAVINKLPNLDLEAIDEVILGCANQAGEDNRNVARMATLLAGIPSTVPALTLNRLCASGLDAIAGAARQIQLGECELIIAGGVESMSRAPLVLAKAASAFSRNTDLYDTTIGWRFVNPAFHKTWGTDSMPETAENVALDFNISRDDQDRFSISSQYKASVAQTNGFFTKEITPIVLPTKKDKTKLVDIDEHPRSGTTLETLHKLKSIVKKGGTVTAGNSSGVNDGAAAIIVASKNAIRKHNLTPIARIVGFASAGVPPRVMGIGPVHSTNRLLNKIGMGIREIDVIELNEAFAAQALAVLRQLGVPDDAEYVNPNGGAISLGHPLGMSGTRLIITLARHLQNTRGKFGLATMCVGVGQGVSMVLARV